MTRAEHLQRLSDAYRYAVEDGSGERMKAALADFARLSTSGEAFAGRLLTRQRIHLTEEPPMKLTTLAGTSIVFDPVKATFQHGAAGVVVVTPWKGEPVEVAIGALPAAHLVDVHGNHAPHQPSHTDDLPPAQGIDIAPAVEAPGVAAVDPGAATPNPHIGSELDVEHMAETGEIREPPKPAKVPRSRKS